MEITKGKIGFGITIVVVLWVISAFGIDHLAGIDHRGSFGDMFGAINALFSGLALFGVIFQMKRLYHNNNNNIHPYFKSLISIKIKESLLSG